MDDRELIRALKALADATRFRMLQEIAAAGELSCGEIAEHFDVSQPTISHHLKILGDAELVLRRSEGRHHFLLINDSLLEKLVDRPDNGRRNRLPGTFPPPDEPFWGSYSWCSGSTAF
jgi:ArsR family transcriptional regulator, arsenate/arsenite/antimonite-responsive transcriptional repressor